MSGNGNGNGQDASAIRVRLTLRELILFLMGFGSLLVAVLGAWFDMSTKLEVSSVKMDARMAAIESRTGAQHVYTRLEMDARMSEVNDQLAYIGAELRAIKRSQSVEAIDRAKVARELKRSQR